MDKNDSFVSDIMILLTIIKSLSSYLPCNVQRGPEWMEAWDLISEDDKNSIIEEAAIATDVSVEISRKYKVGD